MLQFDSVFLTERRYSAKTQSRLYLQYLVSKLRKVVQYLTGCVNMRQPVVLRNNVFLNNVFF